MPLIVDLHNHAMRDRHWQQLQEEIQKTFDYKADDFTLEKIIDLGFDQYAEKVSCLLLYLYCEAYTNYIKNTCLKEHVALDPSSWSLKRVCKRLL